jgi:hypothetical protein
MKHGCYFILRYITYVMILAVIPLLHASLRSLLRLAADAAQRRLVMMSYPYLSLVDRFLRLAEDAAQC